MKTLMDDQRLVLSSAANELQEQMQKDLRYLKAVFMEIPHQPDADTKAKIDALIEKHKRIIENKYHANNPQGS